MKFTTASLIITFVFAIICIGCSIAITYAIATSNLPEWVKFLILTR